MSEFNDRMAVQRRIVKAVNAKRWGPENLFGLSSKAIERWLSANMIDNSSPIAGLLTDASARLFFLAAKSQEQISEEYQLITAEVDGIVRDIERESTLKA
jgi:hypothetical protein